MTDNTDTETPTAEVAAIVTPCHATPLLVTTRTEGRPYLTYDVPDTIECQAPGCYNTWDATGTPLP
jgi:hypothetical protein